MEKQLENKDEGHSESYDPSLLDLTKLEGVHITNDGYVKCKTPKGHLTRKGKWILEHRLVMEKKIGRCLTSEEKVHHKDENKRNNHEDNLKLCKNSKEHSKNHDPMQRQKRFAVLHNEEWIRNKYIKECKTISEIANELGCARFSVDRVLTKFNIPRRTYTVTKKVLECRGKGSRAKKPRSEEVLWKGCGLDWIKKEYTEKQRSFRNIGEEVGWHKNKVKKYLEHLGVPIRSHKEQAGMFLTNYNKSKK